jgi:hypothetical protein
MSKTYDNYFGGCPNCGGSDGYANIRRGHWFYCRDHQTRWCIGTNLFSSWRDETEAEQRAWYTANNFGAYEKVEPLGMLNDDLEPIAGDRASYPSPDDWLVVVRSRQKKHPIGRAMNEEQELAQQGDPPF